MRIDNWHFAGRWILSAALMLTLGAAAGCSADREPGELFGPETEVGTLVIDALLIVDRPLPAIYIRQTLAPGERYTSANAGVAGASVTIRQGDRAYPYASDPRKLGRYLPPAGAPAVLPETLYELTVASGDRTATSATTTPDRIQISQSVILDESTLEIRKELKTFLDGEDVIYTDPANQVNYLDGLLEARFNPVDVKAYQVGIQSLDLDSERVLDVDWLDEEDYEDLERQESSPPFEAKDGKLRLPWFAIYFGGRHLIRIYALDTNWFDFVRSSPDEMDGGGFGGLAGENFERPIFHVEGGIGLFGSASVDSIGFFVLPKKGDVGS
jgi:hypothetical protein